MADKTWYEGERGIYSKIPKRGPLTGKEVFYGRVWLPSEKRFVHFRLGTTLGQARKKIGQIAGDPEKALTQRERRTVKPLMFPDLVQTFLAEYRTRGESGYYQPRSKAWLSYFDGWRVPTRSHPAGCDPSSPVLHGMAAVAFRPFNALGTPEWHSFRGYQPTAHRLACLCIDGPVAGAVARLATCPGGLTPGRAGFARAGQLTKFHGGIASSYPLRPALPGHTEFPMHSQIQLRTAQLKSRLIARGPLVEQGDRASRHMVLCSIHFG